MSSLELLPPYSWPITICGHQAITCCVIEAVYVFICVCVYCIEACGNGYTLFAVLSMHLLIFLYAYHLCTFYIYRCYYYKHTILMMLIYTIPRSLSNIFDFIYHIKYKDIWKSLFCMKIDIRSRACTWYWLLNKNIEIIFLLHRVKTFSKHFNRFSASNAQTLHFYCVFHEKTNLEIQVYQIFVQLSSYFSMKPSDTEFQNVCTWSHANIHFEHVRPSLNVYEICLDVDENQDAVSPKDQIIQMSDM